jgi:hypothetical protein
LEKYKHILLYFATRIFENFEGPFRDLKFSESPLPKNFFGRPAAVPLINQPKITL